MLKPIRRVVTGHDQGGKAVVVMDGVAANVVTSQHRPGGRTNLWRTTAAPADLSGRKDAADAEFTLAPPPRGTNFRISEFPPEDPEEMKAIDGSRAFAEVGAAQTLVAGARHPFMHRTATIDYAIVLEGEITLLLDDSEVALKAGDVVIQRGTNHAWSNRGERLCRMAFILIDAEDRGGGGSQ